MRAWLTLIRYACLLQCNVVAGMSYRGKLGPNGKFTMADCLIFLSWKSDNIIQLVDYDLRRIATP